MSFLNYIFAQFKGKIITIQNDSTKSHSPLPVSILQPRKPVKVVFFLA